MDCSGCAGWECIHYIRDKGRIDSAIQSGLPAQSIKVRTATTVELLLTLLQAGDDIIIEKKLLLRNVRRSRSLFRHWPSLRSGHFLGSIFVSVYAWIFLNGKTTARGNDPELCADFHERILSRGPFHQRSWWHRSFL